MQGGDWKAACVGQQVERSITTMAESQSHMGNTMRPMNQLPPEECSGLEEIRSEIDRLDRAIIELLGRRLKYVRQASRFKVSRSTVRAPDRFKEVLATRRAWAEQEGLNADTIEKLYTDLVSYFIGEELKEWKDSHESP